MARKKKSDETPEAVEETASEATGAATDESIAPEAEDAIEDAETVEMPEPGAELDTDAPEAPAAEDESAESIAEEDFLTEPAPEAHPETQIIRKGGFLPLLLGGVAAAAIGAAAAFYLFPDGAPWAAKSTAEAEALAARLDTQAAAIDALKAATPDLSPLESQLSETAGARTALSGRLDQAIERLDGIEARITALESRPITSAASPEAVAAYERELKALQEAMAAQRADIEKVASAAAQKEANAELTAQQAMQRAAVSRILTALDTGTGYADAVSDLSAAGVDVPPALAQHADTGVASLARLADSFPEAARAALAVARKGESGGGFSAFLKNQFGARSLEPREGADADAVLSRAEAAVNEGRLTDAMAELDALPEEARAEMSDWLGRAAARVSALSAAEKLAANTN